MKPNAFDDAGDVADVACHEHADVTLSPLLACTIAGVPSCGKPTELPNKNCLQYRWGNEKIQSSYWKICYFNLLPARDFIPRIRHRV
jgi:hypothetical protein